MTERVGVWVVWIVLGFGTAMAGEFRPDRVLQAGPDLAIPSGGANAESAQVVEFVPEIDPVRLWPRSGDAFEIAPGVASGWAEVATTDGSVALNGADPSTVTWIAFYAWIDRFAEWVVEVDGVGALRLFVDGAAAGDSGDPGDSESSIDEKRFLGRGMHRILVRVERAAAGPGAVSLSLTTKDDSAIARLGDDPRHPVAAYDELRFVASISGLALSPDGELLAYNVSRRDAAGEESWSRLDLVDSADGKTLAASLGGAGSRAVAWRRDGRALLFRNGESLFTWSRDAGTVARVLQDEPGLGSVSWSPDGSFLVFASTRGVDEKPDGHRRRVELRERLSDWPTDAHLHLLMLDSGVRRRLAVPGDWTQDAFEILPDNRTLLYLRNVPMSERPWFETEFHKLNLSNGEDTLLNRLTMGFENRPGLSGLAVSPDGGSVAFVGPPSELGAKTSLEPNAFDPDLFVMDLSDGAWYRLTEKIDASVNGSIRWTPDSRGVWFSATDGSRNRLVRVMTGDRSQPGEAEIFEVGGERVHAINVLGDGRYAAVVSLTDRLPELLVGEAGSGRAQRTLADENAGPRELWTLASPVDASYVGPDGTQIEGWLYRPSNRLTPSGEKLPLIVYYYGGAMPTMRGFNEFHQFLVGNGYALFVMNPRGANGYGQAFADQHVAEWGERAGADILAGVQHVLEHNDDLDPARVGCYGGSYGGFMTMWLIAHSERFAAAVSLYGISNIASYQGDGMWGWTYGDQAINRLPWRDPEWFVRHSPLFSADRIRTPLLLLHGDDDGNVPPGESEQMFTALRLLDRPVELVRFPDEDHGLRGSWENRVAHRTMLLEWFDRYLRGQPQAWEERW